MDTNTINIRQLNLDFADYYNYLHGSREKSKNERGAVFTKREVVDFILDLSSYTIDLPLYKYCLLEPSFGEGDFLLPAVSRLLTSYKNYSHSLKYAYRDLSNAVRGVEIHKESIKHVWTKLFELLTENGISCVDSNRLLEKWLIEGDFLLLNINSPVSHIVGNPPYVRQEMISDALMAEYRLRFSTIYDRADIYIPFIEKCLDELEPKGILGFICANRWMKNKYGSLLRDKIANSFHLAYYIDMVDTPAFHTKVTAYPAITIIKREKQGSTRISRQPDINSDYLRTLATDMKCKNEIKRSDISEIFHIAKNKEPWILNSPEKLNIVRRLENEFPCIEDAGCKIGIGVATGADKAYINNYDDLDVEEDRKLPLIKTKDIESGEIHWLGKGVINPFNVDGSLVDLAHYPKLAAYFNLNRDLIMKRKCAKKNPQKWYRTIDKIIPELTQKEKLLIPDIKGDAHIVYDRGQFYPHHNLYYIVSDEWNLLTLKKILQSGIAKLFVSLYSTQMRGGFLRFQAQYLRRIRIPKWNDVSLDIKEKFHNATIDGNDTLYKKLTSEIFKLNTNEQAIVFESNIVEDM